MVSYHKWRCDLTSLLAMFLIIVKRANATILHPERACKERLPILNYAYTLVISTSA